MGGAGAGAGGFLFAVIVFASPLTCLSAALIAWILVLPRWTIAALGFFIASCALQRKRPVEPRCQAFSACHFHGMSSSMRLIL